MIGTIDVEVNAAHPELPLCEFAAFVGSPSHVRVRNVPRGVGNWQITAVYLSVNYPDNSLPSVALTHVGALWTGTISGSAAAGRSVNGYQITADGLDESGNAITGYVLGVGDVIILNRDATITVDGVTHYLHWLDAVPTTPHIGDVATIDGTLKLYNGSAWVSFAAGASIDVVPPSIDQDDEGKAADAKATGDALAAKLSRAEAEAGFTEWVTTSTETENPQRIVWYEGETSGWVVEEFSEGEWRLSSEPKGDSSSVSLTWSSSEARHDCTATRTRLPTMADIPTKTSDLTNDSGFLTQHQQLVPVYSQTPTFSEWTISPSGKFTEVLWGGDYGEDEWLLSFNDYPIRTYNHDPNATSVSAEDLDGTVYTATRTRTDIIGYTLGTQSDKPLQPQGHYAPATNIAKTALASAVQASLGKADTAVQPSALHYNLVTITMGQLQDRVVQKVTLNAASTTLILPALTDLTGKVSDFGIDMVNAYEDSGTPAAASFQLSGTLGTDYNLIVPKGETWSDMTALAAGEMAVFYFTLSAFQTGDVPTWEVVKKVVEFVPVPTAP